MAKRVMEKHPSLARQENERKHTPMHLAANEDKVDVLTALLEHDRSLGYLISTLQHLINMANNNGETALHLAARKHMTNIIAAHPDIDVTVLDNAGNQVKALPSMDDGTVSARLSGVSAMDESSGSSDDR